MGEQFNLTVHPYLQQRWERVGRKLAFNAKDKGSWQLWQDETRRKLKQLTGYDTMTIAPLNPRILEETEFDDYKRQHVIIQTEPGIDMALFVLIPKNITGPFPAVVAPHGHSSGGKLSVAGCTEYPEINAAIEKYKYDYGLQFVRAGFITFCPDARGFGERREKFNDPDNIMAKSCSVINNMALPLGQTVTGMWTWDIHRLIDYIEERTDCQQGAIGCAGLSGGGLQTLWSTALDDRIKCAIVSGYMYGYKQALLDMPNNCHCNYVPHLYEYVDMGDIAALIAPRPLLVETGNKDPLNGAGGLDNVYSQMNIIQQAYDLFDKSDLLAHFVFDGEHMWNGQQAVPWMKRFL